MKSKLAILSGAFLVAGASIANMPTESTIEHSPSAAADTALPSPTSVEPKQKQEPARDFLELNPLDATRPILPELEPEEPAPAPAPPAPAPAAPAPAPVAPPPPPPPPPPAYPNNLDGWIREAQAILRANGIPVPSYNGIHRNIIRESSGNPNAINNWDINAINGVPSKGLLQTIDPTFRAYHVPGTSWNPYDPVANIAAACNYAYHRYGSMDAVFGAY